MPFFYKSGEEVRRGDRIIYNGEKGEIEFLADPSVDPHNWYVREFGGGVMISEPRVFGRVFIPDPANAADLRLLEPRVDAATVGGLQKP